LIEYASFMDDPLRTAYDFALTNLEADQGSRGRVFRAVPAGSRVLDVGCDTGRLGEILRRDKNCVVHGIERDPRAAAEAGSRLDHVDVRPVESEASLSGFTDFDVVMFLDVLEHLYDPWSVLRGARSTLRSGGVILSVVPNIAHLSVVRRLLAGRFEYQEHGTMDKTHLRWFTRRSFAQALEEAGFVAVRIEAIPVVPYLQALPRIGSALAERLGRWMPDQLGGSLLGIGMRS
jgi:2-polyprenyl-3-methyl-5-hydroxy-6-metoxy-1,4-benzoquinol methylase